MIVTRFRIAPKKCATKIGNCIVAPAASYGRLCAVNGLGMSAFFAASRKVTRS